MDRRDLGEREVGERRGHRRRPELAGRASELAPRPGIGDIGGGKDGDSPGPRDAAANPQTAMLVEPEVDTRLDVDLVGAERAFVDRTASVADHFRPHAVHGR
jgi:hypothetical protein